jgi:lipoprotein-anchoring transpeptidase ErfK/SrfK
VNSFCVRSSGGQVSLSPSLVVLLATLGACAREPQPVQRDAAPPPPAPAPAPSRDLAAEEVAHHRALVEAAHALYDAGAWEGARLGATSFVTSVLSAPVWPEDSDGGEGSVRLGYMRHGARVPVIPDPIVNDSCPDGWLELVAGGFVCGKNATLDPKNPRVRLAPHGPDLTKSLPYEYGVNLANGTPLYRRVLSIEDRKKYEPWLVPAKPAPIVDAGASDDDEDPLDAGVAPPVASERRSANAPDAAATPWFLRDGGSKEVTLEELHGHGVLVRRMVRGFVLALDRDFKAAHAHWWRNTSGFAIPFERVAVHYPLPEFRGAWLGGHPSPWGSNVVDGGIAPGGPVLDAADEGGAPPEGTAIGFVRSSTAHALVIDPEKKKIAWGAPLEKRSVVELTDETYAANGGTYRETTRGTWVNLYDVQLATPGPPPADLAPGEKWIDVDLTHQTLVAFEGTHPVYATLVSTGKRVRSDEKDKTKDHPTPTGTFRIQSKHVSATMDGDVAADAPYSIEDVPWVMYFEGSYALHGAFWHANFGHQMSHGCVNLSPADARQLFGWTEPRLPEGWHGVFANAPTEGTRVVIHE